MCVCWFYIIVRQSKQCKWLYTLWDFKCFNVKKTKTNFTHLCVHKIFIIVGQSQHCQILILIFYCVKIVCWIQFWNLGFGLHVCVCVCLFFSIVRQSKQCKWLYSLWDFKCFNANNNKTNLPTCVCVKSLSLLGSPNIVRY